MPIITSGPMRPPNHAAQHGSGGTDPINVAISQVTGLSSALATKADAGHEHEISDVEGLQDALDAKANSASIPATAADVGALSTDFAAFRVDGYDEAQPNAKQLIIDGTLILDADSSLTEIGLSESGVMPGSYTAANITVDAYGRVTAAAHGSGGGGGSFDPDDYGSLEGGVLQKAEGSTNGAKWTKGLGFNARLVTTTAGPFNLTDGDQIEFKTYVNNSLQSYTLTVTTADVDDVDAVEPAEIAALVAADNHAVFRARVRDDGKLEFFAKGMRSPAQSFWVENVDTTMATAFGFSGRFTAFGSGATPGVLTSVETAPFSGSISGKTLTVTTSQGEWTSAAFQSGDEADAALIVSRITGSPGQGEAGFNVEWSSGHVILSPWNGGSIYSTLAVSAGDANAELGFPTTPVAGDGGAFDEELLSGGGEGGGGGQLLLTLKSGTHLASESTFENDVLTMFRMDFGGMNGELDVHGYRSLSSTGTCEVELYDRDNAEQIAVAVIASEDIVTRAKVSFSFPVGARTYEVRTRVTGDTATGYLYLCFLSLEY